MHAIIQKLDLVKAIERASKVCETKGHIAFEASKKTGLSVKATDLTTAIATSCAANVIAEGGFSIPSKDLAKTIKTMPDNAITITDDITTSTKTERTGQYIDGKAIEETITVEHHKVTIQSGAVVRVIAGASLKDYPAFPDTAGIEYHDIDHKLFSDMIDKVLFSVSNDDTSHLNGIFYERPTPKTIRLTSTDGHRLSSVERETSCLFEPKSEVISDYLLGEASEQAGIIIPRKGALTIQRLFDEKSTTLAGIGSRGSNMYISRGDVTIAVKMTGSQFPDYQQVIPTDSKRTITLHKLSFIDALSRVKHCESIRLSVSEKGLDVIATDEAKNDLREHLIATLEGEPIDIGFNPVFLLEPLKQMISVEVEIHATTEIGPIVLTGNDDGEYLALIMPQKL